MRTPWHSSLFPRSAFLASVSLFCLLVGDVSAGTYLSSSHGGRNGAGTGVSRASLPASYANGNCAHCHEQHASIDASIGGGEPAPANGPAKWLLLDSLDSTTAGNAACDYCHDGSVGAPADNITTQISKAYKHNPFSVQLTSPATLVCIDCHESHTAQDVDHTSVAPTNLVGTNSPLLGVTGKSATFNVPLPPTPGAENMPTVNLTDTAPNQITYEYELCFKCHAGGNPLIAATDVAPQFDLANYSAHPVYGTNLSNWKNAFLAGNPGALVAPWNVANVRMFCSDCHGSETGGDPEGPHGSTIQYILKAGTPGTNLDALCLTCHQDPGGAGMSAWIDPPNVVPYGQWYMWAPANPRTANQIPPGAGPHALAVHRTAAMGGVAPPAGPPNPAGCVACHGGPSGGPLSSNIHGANFTWANYLTFNGSSSTQFLLQNGAGNITQNYYNNTIGGQVAGNRRCVAACHANAPWNAQGYLY